MKPYAVRRLIANLNGVKWDTYKDDKLYVEVPNKHFGDKGLQAVPDPWTDLNVIQAYVRELPLHERDLYIQALTSITQKGRMATVVWALATARPEQCCEAYLCVKGKWVNE